jgi:hypothetical protein
MDTPQPRDRYSAPQAASLLGLKPEAVRSRIRKKRLPGGKDAYGKWWVSKEAVEARRREILAELQAGDARFDSVAPPAEHEQVAALKAENVRLRSAIESMLVGARGLQEASRGHVDALQQLLLPVIPND